MPLETAAEVVPDVLLVPMLAFDRRGYRLGYGGGFYDRTLAELRKLKPVTAIGVAYAEQEMDEVPIADYDEPLDWIMTERGVDRAETLILNAACSFSAMSSAAPAATRWRASCRNCANAMRPISSSSMARMPRMVSASPRTSINGLIDAGADVVTLGNHSFDQREALVFIERVPNMLRPLNYPPGVPGQGRRHLHARRSGQARAGDEHHGPGDDRAAARRSVPPPSTANSNCARSARAAMR